MYVMAAVTLGVLIILTTQVSHLGLSASRTGPSGARLAPIDMKTARATRGARAFIADVIDKCALLKPLWHLGKSSRRLREHHHQVPSAQRA